MAKTLCSDMKTVELCILEDATALMPFKLGSLFGWERRSKADPFAGILYIPFSLVNRYVDPFCAFENLIARRTGALL